MQRVKGHQVGGDIAQLDRLQSGSGAVAVMVKKRMCEFSLAGLDEVTDFCVKYIGVH